jgi:hypothetical protein
VGGIPRPQSKHEETIKLTRTRCVPVLNLLRPLHSTLIQTLNQSFGQLVNQRGHDEQINKFGFHFYSHSMLLLMGRLLAPAFAPT